MIFWKKSSEGEYGRWGEKEGYNELDLGLETVEAIHRSFSFQNQP